jgi:choline dehydrogenase
MSEYNFIVVGAGAGGAVVANRLSENPNTKVLLLEAGSPDIPDNVRVPYLWYTLFGSSIDWGYASTPQPGLNNRQTYEPRGKTPGGSSNLYLMMHIRGHRSDYDNWAYNGAPGWAYDDLLPFFKKSENQEDFTNPTAGHGGAINLINAKDHNPNPTSKAFIDACLELGFPYTEDFNGPNMEGAGWHHINVKNGKRHGANEAYIEPIAGRKNFTLSTNSYATRLLFEGNRCVGVEYVQDGQTKTARATGEVIVAGGALESPKLLMLSGIGPASHLKEMGIGVKVDLPGVGQNFHNHVLTGVIYECKQPVPAPTLNLSESALFLKSDPGWVGPDLQIGFVHVPFDIIVGQGHPNSISILPGVVRPLSRGWIKLASSNPADKPLVNPNYLGADSDRERLLQAVKLAREIFATKAFSEWVGAEMLPGPEYKTDADLNEFVKKRADSYHHQAGSCKMGLDQMAVVDPQLRVYGVERLRVADASVFPVVQSGNCHSGVLVVGEKCADMIKKDHGLS